MQLVGKTLDGARPTLSLVLQDELLIPTMTVRETLTFSAKLRCPADWTQQQIDDKVDAVMNELAIDHIADSRIGNTDAGGISGGERRRVAIGVELVTMPSLMLLDEVWMHTRTDKRMHDASANHLRTGHVWYDCAVFYAIYSS